MRTLLASLILAAAVTAAPASAAVTVSSVDGEITAQAGAGERNLVGLTTGTDYIQVTALHASGTSVGPGCEAAVPTGVRCARKGVKSVNVQLGDRDDFLGVGLAAPNDPALTFSGGDGVDAVNYGGAGGPVTVSLDGQANDGRRGRDDIRPDVEQVTGTVADDTLTGGSASERLTGDAGIDTISGGAGDDFIDGLDFVDCESEGDCERPQRDLITCGDGIDTVDADATDEVAADCELVARSGNIVGSLGPDVISAWRPGMRVFGRAGDDRITGPGRNDLNGGSGEDYVRVFAAGESQLTGGSGNDRVISGRGDDYLSGGYGNDRLYGYRGNDTIQGGAGRDRIVGGPGDDSITSRDRGHERDVVDCGSGRKDAVIADRRDRVARSCERVYRR